MRLSPSSALLSALFATATGILLAAPPEPYAAEVLRDVLAARDSVLAADHPSAKKTQFIAFWDFDGTILRGDCSEGLKEGGTVIYQGLAQISIERGFSQQYPASPDAFARFWDDYQTLDKRVGHWLSYPYITQMLHGAKAADVRDTASRHFRETFAKHYFSASMHVLRGFESAGVTNYVISASSDLFVDAAAGTLGLPVERMHGIEQRLDADGRVTTDVLFPVTYGEGKLQKLLQIVAALHAAEPGNRIVVLSAFGNSYSTDGPFLEYVARQSLPGNSRPVVVMIDGGEPPERYRGLFRAVSQRATVE